MSHRWMSLGLVVLVGAVLALAGCSQSPLGPVDTDSGDRFNSVRPPLATFDSDGVMDYVTAPVAAEPDSSPVDVSGSTPTSITATARMDGNEGGTVRAGRFSVTIPAGAFVGPATVTLCVPDPDVMICELSISPKAANQFKVPAQLTADLSSVGMTDASEYTNYWYDPARQTWVSLVAKSRCSGTLITTDLQHFSTYGSGKAGW